MASYKPYIKKSNDGAVDELPLDATTLGGIGANGFARASHTHTKSEVGLGNVDNTADANKNVKYATTAGSANSVAWTNVSNKPTTYPPDNHNHDDRYYTESEIDSKLNGKANSSHTHDYLPLSGGALTGTLDLSSSSSRIKFTNSSTTAYYITNIESGSVSLSGMNQASSGTRKTISVNFHNGSKGSGSWYVVATAKGSSSTFPEYVTVGVTSISNSGFTIHARKITSSPGGSPDLDVHYIAIKYY